LETPNVVGGRYELLEQVGGSSWRAADTELEREVLVRMAAAGVGAARLSHPSIVQVFDQGEHEGESYAVFEYAGGGTLADRLQSGGIDAATAERVAADVTAALAYAHAQGVTHGSLGPEQVLFDAEGNPKVAGFGGPAEAADDDREALAALVATLGIQEATEASAAAADVTAVLEPLPAGGRRKPLALIAGAAIALLLVGVAVAFLASGDDGTGSGSTGAASTSSTESTQQETEAPVVPPPATTVDGSTATTAQTTTAPETTAPATTAPATTEQSPTTAPPPTTEPPPTSEPPATTEPPPTTEPLPPVTTPVATIG
jgi:serine/threonine protein kinase